MQRAPVAAFALLIGTLTIGRAALAIAAEPEPAPPERKQVVITTALVRDLVITRRYLGKVVDPGPREIHPIVPGLLSEIAVKKGQAVKEGELLFQIDPAPFKAKLLAAAAKRRAVEDEYAAAKKAAANPAATDQVEEQFKYPLLEARGMEIEAANELDFATVRAPCDGIVERVNEKVGSQVEQRTIVASLSTPGLAWVDLEMPETDYLNLSPHIRQTVTELAPLKPGDKPRLGKSQGFAPDFNSEGNMLAQVRFPNHDGAFQLGQIVLVQWRTTIKDAVLIPRRAMNRGSGGIGQVVFVVGADRKAREREVRLSFERDDQAVVRGLKPEEKIIVFGFSGLKDGDPVQAETRLPEEFTTTYEQSSPK